MVPDDFFHESTFLSYVHPTTFPHRTFCSHSARWLDDAEFEQSLRFSHTRPGLSQHGGSQGRAALHCSSPWNGFVLDSEQFGNFANVTTDEQIAAYARNNATSVLHPVGTTLMSVANAHNGAVNPDLTVKNTVGCA
jgi:hypothetical protein